MPFPCTGQHSGCLKSSSREQRVQWIVLLLLGGLVTGLIVVWASQPQPADPYIQTLNTSLQLNIPQDGNYTYFCLHHDGWSGCIQLKHHGNITFGRTVERTTPEVHNGIAIGVLLMLSSSALGFLLLWLEFYCNSDFQDDVHFFSSIHIEDPPPQIEKESTGQEAVESCGGPHSRQMTVTKKMNPQVPSPGDEPQGNTARTIWNVEMDKKIDSHNGTPRFIQAISDKMEDIKDQVKAVTAAFDESIVPKGYDFFIIYCGKNSAVINGIIIPRLKELNITYCEHQEHFIPGRSIFTNIQDCISQSTKVLAVLSEDFFASGWCCKDLDMAMVQATEKQIEHFIVPFKIDDCVIPDKYGDLKNITYFDLTSSKNDSVWEQIRGSLASIRVASMKMEICMCPKHLQIPYNTSTATIWL
ncbi:uncharacterized protein LOC144922513 [Branchiostoma floridae x Branchiostoma belcheri]